MLSPEFYNRWCSIQKWITPINKFYRNLNTKRQTWLKTKIYCIALFELLYIRTSFVWKDQSLWTSLHDSAQMRWLCRGGTWVHHSERCGGGRISFLILHVSFENHVTAMFPLPQGTTVSLLRKCLSRFSGGYATNTPTARQWALGFTIVERLHLLDNLGIRWTEFGMPLVGCIIMYTYTYDMIYDYIILYIYMIYRYTVYYYTTIQIHISESPIWDTPIQWFVSLQPQILWVRCRCTDFEGIIKCIVLFLKEWFFL